MLTDQLHIDPLQIRHCTMNWEIGQFVCACSPQNQFTDLTYVTNN